METPKIKMKRSALAGYTPVSQAHKDQKLELEVSHNVTEKNRVINENGRESYIVGLKAFTPDKVEAIKEAFKDAPEEGIDIEQTNGLFLTANIWLNNGQTSTALPMKGEKIDCTIGEVADRDSQAVLRVTNIKTRAAVQAKKLDLESFFAEEPVSQEAATTVA